MKNYTLTDTGLEGITDCETLAQDLYDQLTCAGLRHDLWPPAPGEVDTDFPGMRLEDAFVAISDYLDAWRERATV